MMGNPEKQWMMKWGTPISGNRHMIVTVTDAKSSKVTCGHRPFDKFRLQLAHAVTFGIVAVVLAQDLRRWQRFRLHWKCVPAFPSQMWSWSIQTYPNHAETDMAHHDAEKSARAKPVFRRM
jgi:hypothetical protein